MSENLDEKQILIFRVGPVVCCVDSHLVDSIVHPQPLHRFPQQADFILGVLQYQNSAISIVNLFHKFELPDPEPTAESRYVMGHTEKGTVGFWVDEVLEVTDQFEIHSAKPPEYSDPIVFECTILWRDKLILKTDFTQLFILNDASPLKEWVESDAGNAIVANYPNSTIEESDIAAWTESVSETSDKKIQALESRGVEFSQMVSFDTENSITSEETIIGDEVTFNSENDEAMTVSPLTELSEFSIADLPEIGEPELTPNVKAEEDVTDDSVTASHFSETTVESADENQVIEALADQYGDLETNQTAEDHNKEKKLESEEKTVEITQTITKADNAKQESSVPFDDNEESEEINLKEVENDLENSNTISQEESLNTSISEKEDIDSVNSTDVNNSKTLEVVTEESLGLQSSENLDLDELYENSNIPQIEIEPTSVKGNFDSTTHSEQDIPASLIENGHEVDSSPKTFKNSSVEPMVESTLIKTEKSVAVEDIQLSKHEESSNISHSIEHKTEVQILDDDDEIVGALASQYEDSKDYQKTDLRKDVEKLDTTRLSVKDDQNRLEKSQEVSITTQESFSASESKVLLDDDLNFELPNESIQELSSDSSILKGAEFEIDNSIIVSEKSFPDVLSNTSIEGSTSVSVNIEEDSENQESAWVSDTDSSRQMLEDDKSSNTLETAVESRIKSPLVEISSIPNPESSLTVSDADNAESTKHIEESNIILGEIKEDSISSNNTTFIVEDSDIQLEDITLNISEPSVGSRTDSIEGGQLSDPVTEVKNVQTTSIVDNTSVTVKPESIQKESQSTAFVKSDNKFLESANTESKKTEIHNNNTKIHEVSNSDDDRDAAKALAVQYGDTDHINKVEPTSVNAQNQIKQSQPELFEHPDPVSEDTSVSNTRIIDDSPSATVHRHDFVEQSKADELTLTFISQDLRDTEIDVDIEPLTNLYTEFLDEPNEINSTELLLKRQNSGIADLSESDSIILNEGNFQIEQPSKVEQPSSISETSSSSELNTSSITAEHSDVDNSNAKSATSTIGNLDDTIVVDEKAREFKEDVKTFFEDNIKDKVDVYNQKNVTKSNIDVDLVDAEEPRDKFLDSIDDKLDEEKELQVIQDKAVGKVIERIERNRDGRGNTSPARVAASILICAIGVFFVEHYWLNPADEEISVPSLELLVESSIDTPTASTLSSNDETLTEHNSLDAEVLKAPKKTIAEVPERYTELPSKAIGGIDAKNAISNENLESVFNWKKHTIIRGDTLWALSERYLNDPFRYSDLARWSNIKNPDKIYPGNEVSYNTSKEAKNL